MPEYARVLRGGYGEMITVLHRGGPCPNFSSAFHKLYIMGQFGDGEGGGRSPLPKFFGTLALRKSGISCPNFGEGGSRETSLSSDSSDWCRIKIVKMILFCG